MSNVRLIPRLDIKGPNLIKGVHLEGLRVVGNPQEYALNYYNQGADELLYIDVVASLYNRNGLHDIVRQTAKNIFIPLTVGGGIRSIEDVRQLLRAGADKIALNTAAVNSPKLLSDISQTFGSQCIVLSIEAKKVANNQWEVMTDNGRERTGRYVLEWIEESISHGIGEILITSIDNEGTQKGFDIPLIQAVSKIATVPVIASGGMGNLTHLKEALVSSGADAFAVANVLHYKKSTLRLMQESIEEYKDKFFSKKRL